MANLSLIQVNQKLAQAKLLVTDLHEQSLMAVHRTAILGGAAFHLVCAYHHYLREIAETYGVKNMANLNSESDLANAFYSANKHPIEAEELIGLRTDSDSWLVQLHEYYDSLWRLPAPATLRNDSLIKLIDITQSNDVRTVDIDSLIRWQREFTALVLRHRETSAEF